MLADMGVDAMVLLKTTRLGALIVASTSAFDLSLVLWANARGAMPLGNFASDMDKLTIGHVSDGSRMLWIHFTSVVLKTGLTLALLYRTSAWFQKAQRGVCRQRIARAEGRTILIRHPAGGPAGARAVFSSLWPENFLAVVPIIDPRMVKKLSSEREQLLTRLEDARMLLASSKRPGNRPMHRTRWLCGPRVDSIDAWTERLLEIDAQLSDARSAMRLGSGTAHAPLRDAVFVVFDSARAAAIASQVAVERKWHVWYLMMAPPPADCLWPNVGRHVPLALRAALAAFFTTLVLFYIVPIGFVSALSTLSNLAKLLPEFAPILEMPLVVAILEGVLPGLALLIFLAVLPAIVRALASASGVQTLSGLDVYELRGMFWFTVVNVFLANVLAGSVFSALKHIIDKPLSIFDTLGQTVPGTSRFFISFILLKAIGDSAGAVSGIVASIIYLLRTRLLGGKHTPRREAACWAPRGLSLGSALCDTLLVMLLTIVFSSVAPLVHLAGGLYFILRTIAVKTQLIMTHEPSYEGGGILWPAVRGRVCATLLVYQATTAGVLGLKTSAAPAIIIIAVIMPLTAVAQSFLHRRFDTLLPGQHAAPLLWFSGDGGGDVFVDADDVGAPSELSEIVPGDAEGKGAAVPDDVVSEYLPPALALGTSAQLQATELNDTAEACASE